MSARLLRSGLLSSAAQQPGLMPIASKTIAAGAPSVSFDSVFSAGFDFYRIIGWYDSSADVGMLMRLRSGGSDNSASSYVRQRLRATGNTVDGERATDSAWFVSSSSSARKDMLTMDMAEPFAAQPTKFTATNLHGDLNATIHVVAGVHTASTSFDGFSLFPQSGTFDAGWVAVYAYRQTV